MLNYQRVTFTLEAGGIQHGNGTPSTGLRVDRWCLHATSIHGSPRRVSNSPGVSAAKHATKMCTHTHYGIFMDIPISADALSSAIVFSPGGNKECTSGW